MSISLSKIWDKITHTGINRDARRTSDEQMIRIFFNQCLAVGFFGLLGQTYYAYIFIGNYGFLGVIGASAALLGLVIHSKGYYAIAKRVAVYGIFLSGTILTAFTGGDFLFHIGVITVLTFSWILFNSKTEKFDLVLCLFITFIIYFLGEFNPFELPDYSKHPEAKGARIIGLIVYTFLVSVFIYFIRRLNVAFGNKLTSAISEKERLLSEILEKSEQLKQERNELEMIVADRTIELQDKTVVLEKQNKEKEVLLKEIHHRVKNNLQIIVSLLNLQSSKIEDKDLLQSIEEMQNRIISMSLVHQRIYQDTSFDAIEFRGYVELLYQNSMSLFSDKELEIAFINNTESDIKIDIDTAIPLGLMINEMITNSFKHAFIAKEVKYQLSIALKRGASGRFSLEYKDNGIGLPDNFSIDDSETLGVQLIEALASQINADLSIYTDKGAVFKMEF